MPRFPQQPSLPMTIDCPPTPNEIPAVLDAAIESHAELRSAKRAWSVTDAQSVTYRRIVVEYEQRLADALSDRARLREAILAFGMYLYAEALPRQHVIFCVDALADAIDARGIGHVEGGLHAEIETWALEGYDRATVR